MTSQVDTLFPIIPQPMALAVNTLAGASGSSTDKLALKPRHWLYHEDVFFRLLSGPLIILHYAMYCFVPVFYLINYSPFSSFEPGTLNQTIRWTLLFFTQCFTAVLAVAWFGKHYKVRKELLAFLFMGSAIFVAAGFKHALEDMAASKA